MGKKNAGNTKLAKKIGAPRNTLPALANLRKEQTRSLSSNGRASRPKWVACPGLASHPTPGTGRRLNRDWTGLAEKTLLADPHGSALGVMGVPWLERGQTGGRAGC